MAGPEDKDKNVQQTVAPGKDAKLSTTGSPPIFNKCIMEGEIAADKTDLEKAVKGGTAPPDFTDPTKYTDTVQGVMKHLAARLKGGVDEAWASKYGYGIKPDQWGPAGGTGANSYEEQWARAFSEMMVFAAYGGIGDNHGFSANTEMTLFQWMDSTSSTPAYTIMVACQHLSSYLLISRGIPSAQLAPNGTTASNGTGGLPLFTGGTYGEWRSLGKNFAAGKSGKSKDLTEAELNNIDVLIKKSLLTPGSMFAYDSLGPEDTTQKGKAHIGSVLRVWGNGMQPIDTGPMAGGGNMDEGSADHDLQTGSVNAGSVLANAFVGAGYVYADKSTVAQTHVDFIKKARPLGFAQLLLADKDKMIRFVSRIMPMYSGSDRFSMGRYAWSLRSLPANLYAIWILCNAKNAGLTQDLAAGKAVKDMSPRTAAGNPTTLDKTSGLWGYPLVPTHVMISSGNPQDTSIHMYRRKIGPESPNTGKKDNWKTQGTQGEEATPGTIFPTALQQFKFKGVTVDSKGTLGTMMWRWRNTNLTSPEWTMKDTTAKGNPQVADTTKGIPYFGD